MLLDRRGSPEHLQRCKRAMDEDICLEQSTELELSSALSSRRNSLLRPDQGSQERLVEDEQDERLIAQSSGDLGRSDLFSPTTSAFFNTLRKTKRLIYINDRQKNRDCNFVSNRIKTSKYSALTFLPRNLFEQFRRFANAIFLFVVLLQSIPGVSPFPIYVIVLPLIILLGFTGIKEAVEDIVRHRDDWRNNRIKYFYINPTSRTLEPIRSRDIRVGDILKVRTNEMFPADLVLLATSSYDNCAYVNTANLDGETAPKVRSGADIHPRADVNFLSSLRGTLEAALPDPKFTGFQGALSVDGLETVGIADENLVLRGSRLYSTEFVYGLVYSTGPDTKVMLNRSISFFKFSQFEKYVNRGISMTFTVQIILSLITATGSALTNIFPEFGRSTWNLFWRELLTSFILFTFLVPMSMYFTIEFMRIGLAKSIEWDRRLRMWDSTRINDEESDHQEISTKKSGRIDNLRSKVQVREKGYKYAQVRSNSVIDELGRVEMIFSDKTGTLTQNKMELKGCFVNGVEVVNKHLENVRNDSRFSEALSLESLVQWAFGLKAKQLVRRESHYYKNIPHSQDSFKEFLLTLLLCNDILVFDNSNEYLSLSPDEIAFVEALKSNEIALKVSNDKFKLVQFSDPSLNDTSSMSFTIHGMLKFSANRKRMTVICEDAAGNLKLYTKGADSIIGTLLDSSCNEEWKSTQACIKKYSEDGNRTLVMAGKTISRKEFEEWGRIYKEACISLDEREKLIELSFASLESNLILYGCTSVEDQLQKDVPETIDRFIDSGIEIVILTGDKEETAVAIARTARIIHSDSDIMRISSENKKFIRHQLSKLMARSTPKKKISLVISGNSLSVALLNFPDLMAQALSQCQSVICNRATPSQKFAMVELAKRRLGKICLAIGDGANDVSMIQKANVGVGIMGKEGSQAAQSSDIVIHEFRSLSTLVLIHGRYSYYRSCKVVYWTFLKNFVFVLPIFVFQFYSSFSSVPFLDPIVMLNFNIALTGLPPLIMGIFEKDIPESEVIRSPSTFASFLRDENFSLRRFVKYSLYGVFMGLMLFWIGFGVFHGSEVLDSSGHVSGIWVFGGFIGSAAITITNLFFLLDGRNRSNIFILSCFVGIIVFHGLYLFYTVFPQVSPNMSGVPIHVYSSPAYWLFLPLVVTLLLFPTIFLFSSPNSFSMTSSNNTHRDR